MKKALSLVLVLLTSVSSYAAGIVSYYPFDGTLEDTVGPYDGTFMPEEGDPNSNYITSPLGLGQALLLDGSKYVDIGYGQPKGEVIRNGSVSLWFSRDSAATGYGLFFGTMNNGVTKAVWAGINPSDFTEFGLRNALGENITWTYDERRAISPDRWYFYAATWGIGTEDPNLFVNEYLDGALVRSGIHTDPGAISWQYPMVLGAANSRGSVEDLWIGALDDIKFYDYSLSEEEIQEEYVNVTGNPVCVDRPDTDVTDDCKVDIDDLVMLAAEWLLDGNLYPE